jgi:hypothetical protein
MNERIEVGVIIIFSGGLDSVSSIAAFAQVLITLTKAHPLHTQLSATQAARLLLTLCSTSARATHSLLWHCSPVLSHVFLSLS